MNTVKEAAGVICGALVTAAIFSMLIPAGQNSRLLKLTSRLFFLLCIAAPFVKKEVRIDTGARESIQSSESIRMDLSKLAEEQLLETFSGNLKDQVRRILEKHGIKAEEIEIGVHIASERRIDITTIRILLPEKPESLGEALTEIQNALGTPAAVIYSGNGG